MSHKIGPHYRVPWRPTDPKYIWVHSRYDAIKGTYRQSGSASRAGADRYRRAKTIFDIDAATDIIDEVFNTQSLDLIIDAVIAANKPPLIVTPHPEYDAGVPNAGIASKPANAIPWAFAERLASELGCDVDTDIVEVARPGRTKLTNFPRFLWQPKFAGAIRTDRSYILADDVCTVAGTLAMLRSHIVEHGGTVVAATTLAHNHGRHQIFPIAAQTLRVLNSLYSSGITDLWKEEIGHGVELLTENEGIRLVEWGNGRNVSAGHQQSLLQLLRDRLAQAAGKGS